MSIPDHLPREPAGRRFTDFIARHLPVGPLANYLTMSLRSRTISPGIEQVTPWVVLIVERPTVQMVLPLLRLPGRKIAELWDMEEDEWLVWYGDDEDYVDEDDDL